MSETTVSYNATLGNLSSAYLAMWTALQSFDSEADRWAEPTDFGGREERMRRAREALKRDRPGVLLPTPEIEPALSEELDADAGKFEEILCKLEAGEPFSPAMRAFADHLGSQGSLLADESVSLARVAQT
ncbi:MAG: hypothetical protein O2968_10415 [Acidobacteria bacterium]|nr:hypothetical protein [Acidobacteriota bacterium]